MELPYIPVVESCRSLSRDRRRCRQEMRPFRYRIHYHHHHIKPMRVRELNDEVYAHSFPSSFRGRHWVELTDRSSVNYLVPEACLARPSVQSDVPSHLRPPVIARNEF